MTASDLTAVVKGIAPVIRDYIARGLGDVGARLTSFEQRLLAAEQRGTTPGPPGEKGDQGDRGPQGERGQDGKSPTPELLVAMVEQAVMKALAGMQLRGEKGEQGAVGPQGGRGEKGMDGLPGRDGRDGQAGTPGRDGEKGHDGQDGIDGRPGVDGQDGAPGRDGTLDDAEFVQGEDIRTVIMRSKSTGRTLGLLRFPTPIYRGVYESGKTYAADDQVTHQGSVWHATKETTDIPGEGATAWVLCVKRGRDGKPGKDGGPGPEGKAGRDLTQMDFNGKKW